MISFREHDYARDELTQIKKIMLKASHQVQLQKDGYSIIENVLSKRQVADVRQRLVLAAQESERRGVPTYIEGLDPNERNVRVFNLMDLDPIFLELIQHPLAIATAEFLMGPDFIISNFTANIAKPGSGSMKIHSDLSIVLPEPWLEPWSLNIIWCLDDVTKDNGGTRFLPGSHRFQRLSEIPRDIANRMTAFEAPAGSVIAMDGRVWHTSGKNVTTDQERALLFGYYSRAFIRPQWNHSVGLSQASQRDLSPRMQHWLGLGVSANIAPLRGLEDR